MSKLNDTFNPYQDEQSIELSDGFKALLCNQDFTHFATVTTRTAGLSLSGARRIGRNILRNTIEPGCSYFWAAERFNRRGESLPDFHIHYLAELKNRTSVELWSEMFYRYGRSQVDIINDKTPVSFYISKYLTKELSDYDFANLKQLNQ